MGLASPVLMRLRIVCLAILPLAFAMRAHAQPGDTLRTGDRVRLHASGDPHPLVGRLLDPHGDTLQLRDDHDVVQPLLGRSIASAERSLGRPVGPAARRGALWGAAITGGLLAMGGAHGMKGPEVLGAVSLYAGVGALIGAVRRPERWRAATLMTSTSTSTSTPIALTSSTSESPQGFAHTLPGVSPRDVIRFQLASPAAATQRVTGALLAANTDSLRLERRGVVSTYALEQVHGLERYAGQTGRAGAVHGGKIGGVIGAVTGGLLGYALSGLCFDVCPSNRHVAAAALTGGFVFGGLGVGVGALIGHTLPRDDWRTVDLGATRR
jgi:hypothetical protein